VGEDGLTRVSGQQLGYGVSQAPAVVMGQAGGRLVAVTVGLDGTVSWWRVGKTACL